MSKAKVIDGFNIALLGIHSALGLCLCKVESEKPRNTLTPVKPNASPASKKGAMKIGTATIQREIRQKVCVWHAKGALVDIGNTTPSKIPSLQSSMHHGP